MSWFNFRWYRDQENMPDFCLRNTLGRILWELV